MSRGGKRPGAGRPKGAKHKITESVIREAAKAGVTPLEYMLDVMRTMADEDPDRADRMAIAAAPYIHVKKKRRRKPAASRSTSPLSKPASARRRGNAQISAAG